MDRRRKERLGGEMLSGIHSAGSGIIAAESRQLAVAENLANVDMPGFRRMFASLEQLPGDPSGTPTSNRGVTVRTISRDFHPGPMQVTERNLDVALDGPGFFVVEGPRGPLYTRNGVMQVDPNGRLATSSGFPFAGVEAMPPDFAVENLVVQSDGSVWAGDQSLGKLELAHFADPHHLTPVGVVYFEAPPGTSAQAAQAAVRQGQREGSNVLATEELVQMIVGLRHHEASQRALRTLSDVIGEHTRHR